MVAMTMNFKRRSRRRKRLKKCPDCKGTLQCRTCKGKGEVKIIHARQKGQCFERKIAKQVSTWTGVEFKRTPMSGGWAKTGDITPKDPKAMVDFPFNMELKNQEAWTIPMLFRINVFKDMPKAIRKWWKQCAGDAKHSGRVPLLLFTKANEPVFLMVRTSLFRRLRLASAATAFMSCGKFRVILWDEFVNVPYQTIIKRLKGKT